MPSDALFVMPQLMAFLRLAILVNIVVCCGQVIAACQTQAMAQVHTLAEEVRTSNIPFYNVLRYVLAILLISISVGTMLLVCKVLYEYCLSFHANSTCLLQ